MLSETKMEFHESGVEGAFDVSKLFGMQELIFKEICRKKIQATKRPLPDH